MKPFLYCLLIVIFFMFENSSNAQLLSKKEFRLKESKQNLIELSKSIEPVSKDQLQKIKVYCLQVDCLSSYLVQRWGSFTKKNILMAA